MKVNVASYSSDEYSSFPKHILTQEERCKFCFENPNWPRHLVVAIANFTHQFTTLVVRCAGSLLHLNIAEKHLGCFNGNKTIFSLLWAVSRALSLHTAPYQTSSNMAIDEAEDERSQHNSRNSLIQVKRGCEVQSPRISHTSMLNLD